MPYTAIGFLNIVELTDGSFDGFKANEFEVESLGYTFYKELDYKGVPQGNARTKGIYFSYDGLPSTEIINWFKNSKLCYSGILIFFDSKNNSSEKTYFEDATCIGMEINYNKKSNSDLCTKITIMPEILQVGVSAIEQPWATNTSSEYQQSKQPKIEKLTHGIEKTNLYMILNNQEYLIDNFSMDCYQHKTAEEQPIEGVYDRKIFFSISQFPDTLLETWANKEQPLMNGEFQFRREDMSIAFSIKFVEGICVNMKYVQQTPGEMVTNFVITPNNISLNN